MSIIPSLDTKSLHSVDGQFFCLVIALKRYFKIDRSLLGFFPFLIGTHYFSWILLSLSDEKYDTLVRPLQSKAVNHSLEKLGL